MPWVNPTHWKLYSQLRNHPNWDHIGYKQHSTRKPHFHNSQACNPHRLETITQTQPSIKHSSVAQAPPRINMASPTPSVMPHRNPPMNTSKYKQTTLEQYKNWTRTQGIHTQQTTKEPQKTQHPKAQHESLETLEYRHPPIKAVPSAREVCTTRSKIYNTSWTPRNNQQ